MKRRTDREPARPFAYLDLVLLVGLGTLVFLPSIRSHLFLDDYLHAAMVDGRYAVPRGPFDLYDFIGDDSRAALLEHGLLPWWAEPDLTIRFFRPLASALLWFEHRFFSHAALPMHLLSFGWWVLAVLAARALFRRTLGARAARFATFVFALGPCHVLPIAWLANRVTLLSLAFGTVGLLAYAEWRQQRSLVRALVAAVFFTLAFFAAGEYTLAFGGYVIAIEAVRRRESIARRVAGLVPFAVPMLGYLAIRRIGHYGSRGSGFYTDPLNDLGGFLANAPLRLASLLGSSWFSLEVTWWLNTPVTRACLVIVLLLALVVFVPLVRRIFALLPEPNRQAGSWMLWGSLLAIVPSLAVAPGSRVIGASMLGVAATVALVIDRVWFPEREGDTVKLGRFAPLAALGLGFAHLVHGPGSAFLGGQRQRAAARDFETRIAAIRSNVDDVAHRETGVVRGLTGVFFMPFAIDPTSPLPPRWLALAHTSHALALRRDARTIDLVAPTDSALYPTAEHSLYRSTRMPLAKGDEIRVPGFSVQVLETSARGARSARFVFDEPLDALPWLSDDYDTVRRVTLPEIGFGQVFDARGKQAK